MIPFFAHQRPWSWATTPPEVDPANLPLTLFLEADYDGSGTWTNAGTAGGSMITGAGDDPSVGTSQNGHDPAQLDSADSECFVQSGFNPADIIDPAGFYLGVVFRASAMRKASGLVDAPILIGSDASEFGMCFAGAEGAGGIFCDGVTAFINESGGAGYGNAINVPCGSGDYHFAQMWCDGDKIYLDVDGERASSASIDLDPFHYFASNLAAWVVGIGKGYSAGAFLDGRILAVYGAQEPFDDTVRAGLAQRAQTRFGFAPSTWIRRTVGTFPGPSNTTGWNPRDGAQMVRLGSRLLYLGGWSDYQHWAGGSDNTTNEVWKSDDDGVTWTNLLAHETDPDRTGGAARFRRGHTLGVATYQGHAVVMGMDRNQSSDYRGDVWWSNSDGDVWTLKRSSLSSDGSPVYDAGNLPPFHNRTLFMTGNVGDDIYVMGGQTNDSLASTGIADLWKSTDGGLNWTSRATPPWSPRTMVYSPCEHNGKLYVVGGGLYDDGVVQTTGTISIGDLSALVVLSASGFAVDQYIHIVGVAGRKKITNIAGTTLTIDPPANTTVSGANVTIDYNVDYNGVFAYDPVGNSWSTVVADDTGGLPYKAHYVTLASFGGRLWRINGFSTDDNEETAHTFYSEDDGATWQEFTARIGGPGSHANAICVTPNALLYVPGSEAELLKRNVYGLFMRPGP